MKRIDPDSPVPLYHQIAETIRERIENGDLSPGSVLEPMREAACTWGVNLHTVRHAYTALARDGLVELRGARGTRVAGGIAPKHGQRHDEPADRFVDRVVREAREKHGLDPQRLAEEISRRSGHARSEPPVVHVVECSSWQCEAHAREIESRFDVDAREWSLERGEEPPDGAVIATYFHYNDIRRLWPHRLREVRFVTIVPDPNLVDRLPHDVHRVLLLERDRATAENVAADLTVLLGSQGCTIEPVVGGDPNAVIDEAGADSIVLVAPRIWPSIPERSQESDRVFVAGYVIDPSELAALGEEMGWPAATDARLGGSVSR